MSTRRPFSLGWNEPIGRAAYLGWGLALFALKYAMDVTIAQVAFGRSWSPIHYLMPNETLEILLLPPEEQVFYGALVVASLPFLMIGLTLTHRRLIAARLPGWLIVLFFVP